MNSSTSRPALLKPTLFPLWDKTTLWVLLAYLLYTLFFFSYPLTHMEKVLGSEDMIKIMFPLKHFLTEYLRQGRLVLWNPYSSLGQPFLAIPGVAAYYPFNLLNLIFPLSYAITLTYVLHFIITAMGTFWFVRLLGARWTGAFLSGLAFSFSSYFVTRIWAGHTQLDWVAAWMPLNLFLLTVFLEKKQWRYLFAASGALALGILEGHPQITFYTLLLTGFWLLWCLFIKKSSLFTTVIAGAMLVGFSILLSLCQLLPTLELIPLSNRWHWDYAQIMTDYLRPLFLFFFIKPFFLGSPLNQTFDLVHWGGGYHELCAYIGLVPILLALAGLITIRRNPLIGWFWALSILFTLLAMGDSSALTHSVFQFFYDFVPGFGRNRSVARIMVLTFFCLACAAGLTLELWRQFWENRTAVSPRTRLVLSTGLPVLLIAFTLYDLAQFGRPFLFTVNSENYFYKTNIVPGDILEKIQTDPGYPRIQSRDSGYGSFEMMDHVSQLNTYSVQSIIPYNPDLYIKRVGRGYDSPLSDLISLKYLYSPDFFHHPTRRWKPFKDEIVVNTEILPRAYVVGGYALSRDTSQTFQDIMNGAFDIRSGVLLEQAPENFTGKKGWIAGAAITRYENNEMDYSCQTNRPGIFFVSDPYYPGWKCWVDGVEKPILKADGAFRAVVLDQPGAHQIKFLYHPAYIYISLIFSSILWLLLMLSLVFAERFKVMVRQLISW
ncbi:MAG TPA: YfhO family protein [bacterium]|jgi:hypothetical protein|nr:YfhO family protein [bacterium]